MIRMSGKFDCNVLRGTIGIIWELEVLMIAFWVVGLGLLSFTKKTAKGDHNHLVFLSHPFRRTK